MAEKLPSSSRPRLRQPTRAPPPAGCRRAGPALSNRSRHKADLRARAGRLRKAFVGGKLYRASRAGLAQLTRQHTETESVLLRHDLSREQTEAFFQEMKQELDALAETFAARGVRVARETPAGAEVAAKVYAQLQTLLDAGPQVSPSIGRR